MFSFFPLFLRNTKSLCYTSPSPPLLNLARVSRDHFLLSARAECVVLSCPRVFGCALVNGRNLQEMAKFALTVSLAILLQVISVLAVYTEDKCIKGKYHKASPSPETAAFKACHAFKDSSCCTADFTVELMANETRNLYNHSWHRCGQLSEKCQQFWVTQVGIIFKRFTLARIAQLGCPVRIEQIPRSPAQKHLIQYVPSLAEPCFVFWRAKILMARPNEPDTMFAA